jgi:hypothetical protein
MIYHVELYIFADIQLLIFIIAFKNKAVKIKIRLLQRYAAAAFCVMMLLRVIFSFVRTFLGCNTSLKNELLHLMQQPSIIFFLL